MEREGRRWKCIATIFDLFLFELSRLLMLERPTTGSSLKLGMSSSSNCHWWCGTDNEQESDALTSLLLPWCTWGGPALVARVNAWCCGMEGDPGSAALTSLLLLLWFWGGPALVARVNPWCCKMNDDSESAVLMSRFVLLWPWGGPALIARVNPKSVVRECRCDELRLQEAIGDKITVPVKWTHNNREERYQIQYGHDHNTWVLACMVHAAVKKTAKLQEMKIPDDMGRSLRGSSTVNCLDGGKSRGLQGLSAQRRGAASFLVRPAGSPLFKTAPELRS